MCVHIIGVNSVHTQAIRIHLHSTAGRILTTTRLVYNDLIHIEEAGIAHQQGQAVVPVTKLCKL